MLDGPVSNPASPTSILASNHLTDERRVYCVDMVKVPIYTPCRRTSGVASLHKPAESPARLI